MNTYKRTSYKSFQNPVREGYITWKKDKSNISSEPLVVPHDIQIYRDPQYEKY